jgi:hypothetical protein
MTDMDVPDQVAELIGECQSLIASSGMVDVENARIPTESLPSLLEQCRDITATVDQVLEPIRTLHHFACTGGTLISKCVASMPNVQLLSEVAPYSRMDSSRPNAFAPTDLIRLLRRSSQGSDEGLELEIFLRGIESIFRRCARTGARLVIREHCHSKYCVGEAVLQTPGVATSLASEYAVRSVVTVRHPLDSYLSLLERGWTNFTPALLDEYSKRYLAFLDDHEGAPRIRYEDFVADPEPVMQTICKELDLPFAPGFEDTFSVHRLSGDSGRTSATIGRRARRVIPDEVGEQLDAPLFLQLCERLGYDANVAPGND